MKGFVVLGALATAVVAQQCLNVALTAIPSCAQQCFLTGAPSIGCGGTDFTCQCNSEAALYAAIEGCVSTSCPEPSFQVVIDGASSVCDCATGAGAGATATTGGVGSFTTTGATITGTATGATATATASSTGTNTVIGSFTGVPYTPEPALTPTATAGSAPTLRAALGVLGGAIAAALL